MRQVIKLRRPETEQDKEYILELAEEFFNLSGYQNVTKFSYFEANKILDLTMREPLTRGVTVAAFVADNNQPTGFLTALATQIPFGEGVITTELALYSKLPKVIPLLFRSYEYWSKNIVKAQVSQIGTLDSLGNLQNYYKRYGYTRTGTNWIKKWE